MPSWEIVKLLQIPRLDVEAGTVHFYSQERNGPYAETDEAEDRCGGSQGKLDGEWHIGSAVG